MARWALAILACYRGAEDGVLTPETARQMLDPGEHGHGLGPEVDRNRLWFGHGGGNQGFRAQLIVFMDGRGAVVMTNANNGRILIGDIVATLADEYDWPAYRATQRRAAQLDDSVFAAVASQYAVQMGGSTRIVEIARDEDGRMRFLGMGLPRFELLPASEQDWYLRETGTPLTAEWHDGRVVALHIFGLRAERVP